MNKSMKKYRTVWPFVFLAPFVICFLVFSLFPILYSFYMSTLDWAGYNEKVFVGFKNYINIFTKDKVFWKSVLSTLRIGLVGFPISIFLGLDLCRNAQYVKHLKNVLQTANFLPYITTPVAIGMIFTFIFEEHVGILNKLIEFLGGDAINFIGTANGLPLLFHS